MAIIPFSDFQAAPDPGQDLDKADYRRLLAVWGNGNAILGYSLFFAVTMRLVHARTKHPIFARSIPQALDVIKSEFDELVHAAHHESLHRQFDEALDVIATCLRFANREIPALE